MFVTIDEDQQALIFSHGGRGRLVIGPRRLWKAADEELEYLPRYVASQEQYIVVKHRDGHKEHVPGPTERFLNRLEVESMSLESVIKLDANQMVVVYKQLEGKIDRRVVKGPAVFIPDAHEWLHDFIWHGSDRSNPGRFIPNKLKFTKLRHVPSQIYCNVKDVRTNDDTLITVKLMVFYHLVDVETMLNGTHDPIADFINAVQSDVVAFGSQRSYQEFIKETHALSNMDSYAQVATRAKKIGYKISKVVYRGYESSGSLQTTHDNAVQTRTNIRLNKEAEEKEQVLLQFKLKREKDRNKLKQDMERKMQDHQQELEKLRQTSALDIDKLTHEVKLRKEAKGVMLEVEMDKRENEQKAKFLHQIKKLGVDMTQYMLALQEEIVPQREIIVGPATAELHIMQNTL